VTYHPLPINREALTIMDVPFPSSESLDRAANALCSNMFEGFEPTKQLVEIYRDYSIGKFSFTELPTRVAQAL
jgi:hypothetical protein